MSRPVMTPIERASVRAASIAGVIAAALGFTGMLGWLLGISRMHPFSYGFAAMKMNTAVALLLAGSALVLMASQPVMRARTIVARCCAWLVLLLGAATLAEYATGLSPGIDQLLIEAPVLPDGAPPGRMAPNTALCFALIGLSMLGFDSARRAARGAAQIASLFVVIIGFLAVTGYFLSAHALYGVAGYTSMALPTALALTTVAAGLLASRPERGIASILAQQNSAGASLRRLLPVLVVLPLLLAWLQRVGVDARQFSAEFGAALTATLSVCLLSALALRDARAQGILERARSRSNDQVRLAMESAPNGMIIVDAQGRIVLANAAVERLFGYSRADLIGGSIERLISPSLRGAHGRLRSQYQAQPATRAMAPATRELHGVHKNGHVVPVEVGLNPMCMPEGDFVLATIIDVSQREQTERAAERERFFQLSNDALCISNASGYFVQVNPAFERILGYSRDEMLKTPFLSLVHPDDVQAATSEAQKAHAGAHIMDFRNRFRARDGGYRWLQWRAMPDQAGLFYFTARDITQELEAMNALQASFAERGVLLQEVHHRVKNNLQIIASMINMQTRKLQDGAAHDALEECGSRVQAIGLIHETLYQAKDFARIPFRNYATSLVENVFHASVRNGHAVSHQVDVGPEWLTVEKAIPCGLIINELVTNALKHAFPDERRGNIRVGLHEQDHGRLVLSVADDGVGLDAGFGIEISGSMGLTLVATLADQLKGQLTFTRSPGACFEISFPHGSDS